ncbi:MAG: hypothetical protein KGV57_04730 [Fusobacterium sp.]|nr:hypothetical protein [Fusobacterium sp.]
MQREEMRLELNKYLDSDEHLLWIGKPKQGLVFKKADIFMIPFSFIWAGFAIFSGVLSMLLGDSLFESLFSLPFIIVGFYITIGRFLFDILRRKKTIYGITEDRIIIKNHKNITSLNIKTLTNVVLEEKSNNRGDIMFGNNYNDNWSTAGITCMGHISGVSPSFEGIEDARKVYKKIIELREKENDF